MEKKELGLGNMEEQQQQHLMDYSSNHKKNVIMAKGKRTKRLRLLSSNNNCGVGLGGGASYTYSSANSEDSSSTTTYESSDQEDEDMANCLILLARGRGEGEDSHHPRRHHQHDHPDSNQGDHHNNNDEDDKGNCDNKLEKGNHSTNIGTRKFAEMATTTNTTMATTTTKVGGFIIYECKTCNRSFPSFQALGGHRASHKKPKLMTSSSEEKKPQPHPQSQSQPQSQQQPIVTKYDHFEEARQPPHMKTIVPPISLQLESQSNNTSATRSIFNANKAKIHECSICGSEFSSGQALGGHMRRHRAATTTTTTNNNSVVAAAVPAVQVEAAQRRKNILELDLNLPAPEEDLRETKFHQFPATQKSMVLSASPALVDCHY